MTPTPNARAVVEWIDRLLDEAGVPRMTPQQRAVMARAFTKRRRPMGASKTPPTPRERALVDLEALAAAALPGNRLTPPPFGAVDNRRADGSDPFPWLTVQQVHDDLDRQGSAARHREAYLDAADRLGLIHRPPYDPFDDLDGLPLVERINARLATEGIRPLPKDHR